MTWSIRRLRPDAGPRDRLGRRSSDQLEVAVEQSGADQRSISNHRPRPLARPMRTASDGWPPFDSPACGDLHADRMGRPGAAEPAHARMMSVTAAERSVRCGSVSWCSSCVGSCGDAECAAPPGRDRSTSQCEPRLTPVPHRRRQTQRNSHELAAPARRPTAPFVTDGGLETTLVFHDGIDLPDFAAFPLLDTDDGSRRPGSLLRPVPRPRRAPRHRDRARHPDLAGEPRLGRPPRLRRHPPGRRQPPGRRVRRRARRQRPADQRSSTASSARAATATSSARRCRRPKRPRTTGCRPASFAEAGAADDQRDHDDLRRRRRSACTRAATAVGLPVVISFTVETDGRLPSGQSIGDAIAQVDDATHERAGLLHGQLRPPHPLPVGARP